VQKEVMHGVASLLEQGWPLLVFKALPLYSTSCLFAAGAAPLGDIWAVLAIVHPRSENPCFRLEKPARPSDARQDGIRATQPSSRFEKVGFLLPFCCPFAALFELPLT
jgi:hypothetical protein